MTKSTVKRLHDTRDCQKRVVGLSKGVGISHFPVSSAGLRMNKTVSVVLIATTAITMVSEVYLAAKEAAIIIFVRRL